MRKLIFVLLFSVLLCSCTAKAVYEEKIFETEYRVEWIENKRLEIHNNEGQAMRGIWVSQFDMHPIFRNGSKQREESDYREKIELMMDRLVEDRFNTVFLQLRPNGDSMYESEIYPASKYIAGVYGGEISYDAISIFLEVAKERGISVHGWINPFRLCTESDLTSFGKGILFEWYNEGLGKRIEKGDDGILYLDPAYEEATDLIVSGVKEILEKYDFDGIHIDDYFYPTEFEFQDESEFAASGFKFIGDFRKENVNRTVKAIYNEVHLFSGKVFGISPAGNIYSLEDGWYADIYRWCSESGFADYIMPQLYFGFDNATCPFNEILEAWCNAMINPEIKLYIGLSAAKCALGSQGEADVYAGSIGKYEWRDNKDILARSLKAINETERGDGFCIFAYSSFYDPLTGEENPLTAEERLAFLAVE